MSTIIAPTPTRSSVSDCLTTFCASRPASATQRVHWPLSLSTIGELDRPLTPPIPWVCDRPETPPVPWVFPKQSAANKIYQTAELWLLVLEFLPRKNLCHLMRLDDHGMRLASRLLYRKMDMVDSRKFTDDTVSHTCLMCNAICCIIRNNIAYIGTCASTTLLNISVANREDILSSSQMYRPQP